MAFDWQQSWPAGQLPEAGSPPTSPQLLTAWQPKSPVQLPVQVPGQSVGQVHSFSPASQMPLPQPVQPEVQSEGQLEQVSPASQMLLPQEVVTWQVLVTKVQEGLGLKGLPIVPQNS